jgi:NADH-quinone oxidoreductase subunit L
VFVVFFGVQPKAVEKEISLSMSIPLLLLGALALFGGLLQIPLDSVFPTLINKSSDHTANLVSAITIAAPLIGLTIAVFFYLTGTLSAQRLANNALAKPIRLFFLSGWGMDAVYEFLLIKPFNAIANLNKNDAVDSVYIGIAWFSRGLHQMMSTSQTGRIRWYASSMVLGTVVIIAIGLLS